MGHTPLRRFRPRSAAAALAFAILLAVSACQVGGSASADAGALASLQSGRAATSTSASFTRDLSTPVSAPAPSAPGTAPGNTPGSEPGTAPGTIEDHSTSNAPPGTSSGAASGTGSGTGSGTASGTESGTGSGTGSGPSSAPDGTTPPHAGSTVVLADDGYAVSVMVTTVWARALVRSGTNAGIRTIDEAADRVHALEAGEVDMVQEYNGSLLDYLDTDSDATTQSDVDAAIAAKLPSGLSALKSTPARDGTQLVVSASTAAKYRLHAISDLGSHLRQVTLLLPGTDSADAFSKGLSDYYGLTFPTTRTTDFGGPLTIASVGSTASVGLMNDSEYQIDDQKFVALTDPEHLFFLENFIPVTTTRITPAMRSTINAVSAKLTVSAVRGMRKQVAAGQTPAQIADDWLNSVGLR